MLVSSEVGATYVCIKAEQIRLGMPRRRQHYRFLASGHRRNRKAELSETQIQDRGWVEISKPNLPGFDAWCGINLVDDCRAVEIRISRGQTRVVVFMGEEC